MSYLMNIHSPMDLKCKLKVRKTFRRHLRCLLNFLSQQAFALVRTSWRLLQNLIGVTIFCLPSSFQVVLEDEKLLHFIMSKINNRFMISLAFGYMFYITVTPKNSFCIRMTPWNVRA